MSPPPTTPLSRTLGHVTGWLLVATTALTLRLRLRQGVPLDDLPGPGGVKSIAAIGAGHTGRDWATWLMASALPITGDLVTATTVTALGASIAAVTGAMLAAQAIGGTTAAIAAGLITATWSQTVHPALLIGADGIAAGASWLGVGLAWWGSQRWRRVWALAVAAVLLRYAMLVKVTAAPAVALAALAPLVSQNTVRGVVLALSLAVGATSVSLSGPGAAPVSTAWPTGAADALWTPHPEGFVWRYLVQLATVAALIPGRRWPTRLATAVGTVWLLDLAADTGGLKARPRHLATGALGVVVLAGWLVGAVPAAIARLLPRRLQPLHPLLAVVPAGLLAFTLTQETLAWTAAWCELRTTWLSEGSCTLPPAQARWRRHVGELSTHTFTDHSDPGADRLVALGRFGPPGGVATVVLRDNREYHLLAGAALGKVPAVVLDPARCCRGDADRTCARATVAALDRAGTRVVLPTDAQLPRTPRVNHPHDRWLALLRAELSDAQVDTRWWTVWEGSQSGGPLPCTRQGKGH